jgi:hypothetical protein
MIIAYVTVLFSPQSILISLYTNYKFQTNSVAFSAQGNYSD